MGLLYRDKITTRIRLGIGNHMNSSAIWEIIV
jgi:hypothetical protein